jgi:hydrogenase expression/formation protein HypE
MHDPTEGGLAAGFHEVASAAGVALRVDRDRVIWFEPGVAVCHALGADPWATLASGSLLATFEPDDAEAAVQCLLARGDAVAVIGTVEVGEGVFATDGDAVSLPDRDEVARILTG